MRYVMALVAVVSVFAAAAISQAEEPPVGQLVSLDVLFADLTPAAGGEGEITAAKVMELEQQGKLSAAARIKLSVIENSPGTVQFGETSPVETGRQFGGAGQGGRGGGATYSMQNHGTMVQATARIEQDGTIVINLQAERSRLVANRPAGEEADAPAIGATKTTQTTARTTVRVASGKPVIVGGQQTGPGKDAVHSYIVLTATAPEGAKAAAVGEGAAMIKVFTLSHARAADVVKALRPILEGQAVVIATDERTNSVIAHGRPDVLETASALIQRLDES